MGLPRSDSDRTLKYDAKTAPTTVGLKIAARLSDAKTSYQTYAEEVVPMQLLVRAELAGEPTIFPPMYGAYYAFALELWKLTKITEQPALDAAAQVVYDKWTSRGCDTTTCISIALNVFNITVT